MDRLPKNLVSYIRMGTVSLNKARRMLAHDEGMKSLPYDDATGLTLIAPVGNMTIGIGHNLNAYPLSTDVIERIFKEDLVRAEIAACNCVSHQVWNLLSENRRLGLINLAFSLGEFGLKRFVKMIDGIIKEDWEQVEREIRSSLWARQVDKKNTPTGRDDRVVALLAHDIYLY